MVTFPSVFVSHGSPMLVLDGGTTLEAWRRLAAGLPAPRAVLVVSAHWATASPAVGGATRPPTIHDFGGFPQALYRLQYPVDGAPWLAERVATLLGDAGMHVATDTGRGLDHGAWVPLSVMYPAGTIPVAQLAIQPNRGVAHHYRMGQALAALRSEGVLILASGSLTHNLHDLEWGAGDDAVRVPPYVRAFQDWLHSKLTSGDIDALLDYRRQAPGAVRAHPTDEHLLPLHVALGAGAVPAVRRHAGITEGALAMDVYTFGETEAVAA